MAKAEIKPLPPGNYSIEVVAIRKVRNKPLKRIRYRVLETGDEVCSYLPWPEGSKGEVEVGSKMIVVDSWPHG